MGMRVLHFMKPATFLSDLFHLQLIKRCITMSQFFYRAAILPDGGLWLAARKYSCSCSPFSSLIRVIDVASSSPQAE